jgi:2'-5' RNA ligase
MDNPETAQAEELSMRVFAALPLPGDFKQALQEKIAALRLAHPGLRWTAEENLHITLAFLGELDGSGVRLLTEAVQNAASGTGRIAAYSSRLMTFPRGNNASVLALGFDRGHGEIAGLADSIETGLEHLSSEGRYPFRPREKRPFAGHLTIARKGRSPIALAPEELAPLRIGAEIDKVVIFQSELRREGALYTPLEEFCLVG